MNFQNLKFPITKHDLIIAKKIDSMSTSKFIEWLNKSLIEHFQVHASNSNLILYSEYRYVNGLVFQLKQLKNTNYQQVQNLLIKHQVYIKENPTYGVIGQKAMEEQRYSDVLPWGTCAYMPLDNYLINIINLLEVSLNIKSFEFLYEEVYDNIKKEKKQKNYCSCFSGRFFQPVQSKNNINLTAEHLYSYQARYYPNCYQPYQ